MIKRGVWINVKRSSVPEGHMKELCRVIKYALDTRTIGLKIKPEDNDNKLWELKAYSDADFAGDKETRIFLFVLYLWPPPSHLFIITIMALILFCSRIFQPFTYHTHNKSFWCTK